MQTFLWNSETCTYKIQANINVGPDPPVPLVQYRIIGPVEVPRFVSLLNKHVSVVLYRSFEYLNRSIGIVRFRGLYFQTRQLNVTLECREPGVHVRVKKLQKIVALQVAPPMKGLLSNQWQVMSVKCFQLYLLNTKKLKIYNVWVISNF